MIVLLSRKTRENQLIFLIYCVSCAPKYIKIVYSLNNNFNHTKYNEKFNLNFWSVECIINAR